MTGSPSASRCRVRPAPDRAQARGRRVAEVQDPWGVRRAENLLTTLEGMLSARVVTTPLGEVSEVHVLAQSALQPKQVVRNIESALLAHLGFKVDHRKISIAQTADVKPLEALERGRCGTGRSSARCSSRTSRSWRVAGRTGCTVQVSLSMDGQVEHAEEEAMDNIKGRVEAAAKAALSSVDRLLGDHSLALEGVRMVEEFDREFVFIVAQGLSGRETVLLTGTAEIRESAGAGGGVRGDGCDEPVGQPEAALVALSANLLYVKDCEVFGGAGSATWFREARELQRN